MFLRRVAALALAGAVVAMPHVARAEADKRACIAAADSAQELRRGGHLLRAREQLLVCARDACPTIVRHDCAQWLTEVFASLPTVTLGARDSSGHDVLRASFFVDGQPFTGTSAGTAVPLDPGVHRFRVVPASGDAAEADVLVREGEKNRTITLTLETAPATPPPAPEPVVRPPDPSPRPAAGPSPIAYLLAGVGLLAVGSSVYFGVSGLSDRSHLESTCKPSCPPGDIDAVRTKYLVSEVSLGVGVVALGVAVWLLLRRSPEQATTSAILVPAPGGAVAGMSGTF